MTKILTEEKLTRRECYVLETMRHILVANTRICFNSSDLMTALSNVEKMFDKATDRNVVNVVYGNPVKVRPLAGWSDRNLREIVTQMGEWDFSKEPFFPVSLTEMAYLANHTDIDNGYVIGGDV